MEKLAAIRKVSIDHNHSFPKKKPVYFQKKLLISLYKSKKIGRDVYFEAMVKLCGKNPPPFEIPYTPAEE